MSPALRNQKRGGCTKEGNAVVCNNAKLSNGSSNSKAGQGRQRDQGKTTGSIAQHRTEKHKAQPAQPIAPHNTFRKPTAQRSPHQQSSKARHSTAKQIRAQRSTAQRSTGQSTTTRLFRKQDNVYSRLSFVVVHRANKHHTWPVFMPETKVLVSRMDRSPCSSRESMKSCAHPDSATQRHAPRKNTHTHTPIPKQSVLHKYQCYCYRCCSYCEAKNGFEIFRSKHLRHRFHV